MATEDFKRKLTAIFSADVAGYSRLMGEDEAATVKTLEGYRQVMFSLIKQHRGRVIDSPGDNLLAEFVSVVDAVQCAVAVQKELQARNADLSENRRMQFRIGINLGDVIEEGERIYGDGVNIAARLEALADPGGICISKTAFDQIEAKLPLGYHFLGQQTVKNIAKPVGAYKVLMEPRVTGDKGKEEPKGVPIWRGKAILVGALVLVVIIIGVMAWNFYWRAPKIEPASKEKMIYSLPDKPSIAVLPFTNLSEDPKHEHFVDGMTEEIITTLSKVSGLFVIASNSVFTYKGKPIKVQQVSQDLGVRYVLEGSARMSEDRVRVTAQLIDAINGRHLWAERYDRVLQDLFAVQDNITQGIVTALEVKLTEGEQARLRRQTTTNMNAWEQYSKGLEQSRLVTKEGNAEARRFLESAINLDPQFAAAWALLGHTYMLEAWLGWTPSPAQALNRAVELARKAIDLDDSLGESHMTLGAVRLLRRQHDEAIAASERAVALNPNSATIRVYLGRTLTFSGRPEEAVEQVKRAMRLSPVYPSYYIAFLAGAYRAAGRYEEALAAYQHWLELNPAAPPSIYVGFATTYGLLGRETEARSALSEVLKHEPTFSVERAKRLLPYRNRADLERELETLRKIGLPETPPPSFPDKPSIAVLPFVNMSDDKSQEYFSNGLTEEIITALSKTPKLFVIARNSSFVYKGKPGNLQQVSRELGVNHVLEGSVRRSGDQLRITAQLIEAPTGKHLWSERYERSVGEIFAVQDDITLAVVQAMRVTLTSGEQARLIGKGTKNLEAYLKAIQANEQFQLFNRQGSVRAKEFAMAAIALDPRYAYPYAILANAHMLDVWFRFSESPEESMRQADDAAHKALVIEKDDPYVLSALTNVYVMQRHYEKAIASAQRALELSPGSARSQGTMATALMFACRFDEAIPFHEEAVRLDPYPPGTVFRLLGSAYAAVGRLDEALRTYQKALAVNPTDIFTHLGLAMVYVELGREAEARGESKEVLRLHPKFSLEHFAKAFTFKDQAFVDRRIELLRKAGLK